jgi:RNA polymerase sigma-70 factor (ECF subfamily)
MDAERNATDGELPSGGADTMSAATSTPPRVPAGDRGADFDAYRPLLFSIAYRMLGSVMDAEDMIQEAFLRWQQSEAAGVEIISPKAYLSQIVTRLCIDHLRSARVQREQYVGPWLPEPLVGTMNADAAADPADATELADTLSTAFLLLLERLAPRERAVFLLREVFDYDHREVAEIVGVSEANCRQIARRARQYLADERPRFVVPPEQHRALARQFGEALTGGDTNALLSVLAAKVTTVSDGGGKVTAARVPIHGADLVARFLFGLWRMAPPGLALEEVTVNGRAGFVTLIDGEPRNVISFDISDDRIQAIYIVVNPDKLQRVSV